MSEPVNVTLQLNWTYGVPAADGRTDYVGPGRVTLPLSKALALGGNMATAIFHFEGKRYTAETLHEAPEALRELLRKRGIRIPQSAPQPLALTDIAGVGEELATAMHAAGYHAVTSLATADPDELANRVTGIGRRSAPRLIEAAQTALQAAKAH